MFRSSRCRGLSPGVHGSFLAGRREGNSDLDGTVESAYQSEVTERLTA